MKTVYVIVYENPLFSINKKPARGVCNYSFTSHLQAQLQADKANSQHKGIKHTVQALPLIEEGVYDN